MARPPRQPEMSQRGQFCGNSSQAAEEPMSALDGQQPRDLHRLNQLGCPNLVGVDFGAKADRTDASDAAARYANKRAEMWGFMKEWLKAGSLPDDKDLAADLKAVDYGYDASDAILLERKDDMRRRGLASPDDGDALALTFAYPVAKRDWAEERRFEEGLQRLKRWIV